MKAKQTVQINKREGTQTQRPRLQPGTQDFNVEEAHCHAANEAVMYRLLEQWKGRGQSNMSWNVLRA
jgi:hypothetical protein